MRAGYELQYIKSKIGDDLYKLKESSIGGFCRKNGFRIWDIEVDSVKFAMKK